MLAPRHSTDAEAIQRLLDDSFDADVQALAQRYGYSSPEEMANANGFGTIEELAQAWWGYTVPATLSESQIAALSAMMPQISQENMTTLMQNPAIQTVANSTSLLSSFLNSLDAGMYSSWGESQVQEPFLALVQIAGKTSEGGSLAQFDLSRLNTSGVQLSELNFSGTNITMEQLNAAGQISWANLSGLDVGGLTTTGKWLMGVNFSGTNVNSAQLREAGFIGFSDLSGLDLSGFDLAGLNMTSCNFSNSNVTGEQLNAMSDFKRVNLSGVVNLTGLNTAGANLIHVNFSNSGITASQLNQAANISQSTLSGLDLTDLNTANRDLQWADLSGSTISVQQIVSAGGIQGVNLVGTGISEAQLRAALTAAGKDPSITQSMFFD